MTVAYLSQEIGLKQGIPTYAGGLGILAGDTEKAAADNGADVIFLTQLSKKGYATQSGEPQDWILEEQGLVKQPEIVSVPFDGTELKVGAYTLEIKSGIPGKGSKVTTLFLTTDVDGNPDWAKRITDRLYDNGSVNGVSIGDLQRLVLGVGGFKMLQRLGIQVATYHMNEGHSGLLVLPQLMESGSLDDVIERNIFFNHSIEEATMPMVSAEMLRSKVPQLMNGHKTVWECVQNGNLVTNWLAARHSRASFGVSLQHSLILNQLFPGRNFGHITNAVHPPTWVTPEMAELYDSKIGPGWRDDPDALVAAGRISPADMWNAHVKGKEAALMEIQELTGIHLNPDAFTVDIARRATPYKRHDLLFNPDFVQYLADNLSRPLNVIQGGKAHPNDVAGRESLQRAQEAGASLTRLTGGKITYVFLPEYGIANSQLQLKAVDGRVQFPAPGREASGTSGMKGALNGLPNISPREGWLFEGPLIDGVTGFTISTNGDNRHDAVETVASLRRAEEAFSSGRQQAMAPYIVSTLGPTYHSTRMLRQYMTVAWRIKETNSANGAHGNAALERNGHLTQAVTQKP